MLLLHIDWILRLRDWIEELRVYLVLLFIIFELTHIFFVYLYVDVDISLLIWGVYRPDQRMKEDTSVDAPKVYQLIMIFVWLSEHFHANLFFFCYLRNYTKYIFAYVAWAAYNFFHV